VGDPRAIDSAGLLSLTERPASLAVVGGGYVGIELGTALAKLGTRVTIVEAARSLLGRFGSRVGSDMLVRLRELGVTTLLETTVDGIDERGVLVTDAAGEHDVISADLVLAAVGRRPNSQGLGLDRAGIRVTASGHIVVDEALLAARNIAAIGDVIEGPGLAHRASAQAEIAVRALAGERVSWDALVPLVAFSDPEAAAVGLTLEDALELGYDAAESVNSFASVARSHISGEVRGHHSVVYDRETGILLGASITGSHAAELISELTIAIEGALAFGDLEATVHPHPTLAEVAVPAAGTMLSRTIAVPQAQGVTQ
jgi:dihydrolipoamide dehydrogenase